jgi:spore coat protein A, manganese oxidase
VSITRRIFLHKSGLMTATLMAHQAVRTVQEVITRPTLDPNSLKPFVDPLPIPEIARPDGYRPSPADPAAKLPYYRLAMRQVESRVHRDLKPTRFWGFGSGSPGPTFETRGGEGLLVEWVNDLPHEHFLPIDHNLHGAEADKPAVRAVVHLHGAKTSPASDGYPEDWYEPGKSATYYYPNNQDAAMLWYHDHAMGINRLNIYAGLLGAFFVRDDVEDSLNLPRAKREVPLILCDRTFYPDGQLHYPVSPKADAPWVPEVFGNAILVNGKLLPYLEVDPRPYRFRVLNGSNGRFYHLSLANGQTFHQIGTDQGLLPAPVELKSVSLAPGERADLIVNLAGHADERIVVKNDAFDVLQFRVTRSSDHDTSSLPAALRPLVAAKESEAVKTRDLPLVEIEDAFGNPVIMLLNGTHWSMPVTENPVINTVEIWNLINLTDDSHPIHLHLVRFQILDRRPFDVFQFQSTKVLRYRGPAVRPDPGEAGWKDTVRAHPGMVTRIIICFEGFTGRYVWHCHVLEHGDNEMMRPYEVVAAS